VAAKDDVSVPVTATPVTERNPLPVFLTFRESVAELPNATTPKDTATGEVAIEASEINAKLWS
jgi:hypothetical protein